MILSNIGALKLRYISNSAEITTNIIRPVPWLGHKYRIDQILNTFILTAGIFISFSYRYEHVQCFWFASSPLVSSFVPAKNRLFKGTPVPGDFECGQLCWRVEERVEAAQIPPEFCQVPFHLRQSHHI
jgi:hypothetical protein